MGRRNQENECGKKYIGHEKSPVGLTVQRHFVCLAVVCLAVVCLAVSSLRLSRNRANRAETFPQPPFYVNTG